MDHLTFSVSTGLALILTNLDNLTVLFALLLPLGPIRAVAGYSMAQILVLAAAVFVAEGAGDLLTRHAGYLGVIPVSLGVLALWNTHFSRNVSDDAARPGLAQSTLAATLMFLSMSVDSFAVMVPLLADSLPAFRLSGVIGAVIAIAGMAGGALWLSRVTTHAGAWASRAETLGPYVMILVGLYVLLDSGTDLG